MYVKSRNFKNPRKDQKTHNFSECAGRATNNIYHQIMPIRIKKDTNREFFYITVYALIVFPFISIL